MYTGFSLCCSVVSYLCTRKRQIPEPYGYIPVELESLYWWEWILVWSAADNDLVYYLVFVCIGIKGKDLKNRNKVLLRPLVF